MPMEPVWLQCGRASDARRYGSETLRHQIDASHPAVAPAVVGRSTSALQSDASMARNRESQGRLVGMRWRRLVAMMATVADGLKRVTPG